MYIFKSRHTVCVVAYILVLFSLGSCLKQHSRVGDDNYIAAVVEFAFSANTSDNLANYLTYIKEAALQTADLIVFPEMTLTRGHPVSIPFHGALKKYPVPADHPEIYDSVLVSLSNASREFEMYVVLNLEEEMVCGTPEAREEYCPENKTYKFNTNIVFDRTGAIIDRYRKINLFGEYSRSTALQPEIGMFKTDFGVTFGHFICFDLMFQVPSVQIVQKYNITDVLFPTMWFSELPFLTAVQIQEAYAYGMNINFLAAGANNVAVGSAGSGIFSGKAGALASTMPGRTVSRLLIATVPKIPGDIAGRVMPGPIPDSPKDSDSLRLKQDPSLAAHESKLLVPGFQEFTLTHHEVTCKFTVRMNRRREDVRFYRAFVFDGSNEYALREVGVTYCAIVSCQNDSVSSCPYKLRHTNEAITFEELKIEMRTYDKQYNETLGCDNIVYFPTILNDNMLPMETKHYNFVDNYKENLTEKTADKKTLNIFLNSEQSNVVTFGIWGRIYTRDVDHNKKEPSEEDINRHIEIENEIFNSIIEPQALIRWTYMS